MADEENSPIVYKNHEITIPPKLAEKLSGVSVSFGIILYDQIRNHGNKKKWMKFAP